MSRNRKSQKGWASQKRPTLPRVTVEGSRSDGWYIVISETMGMFSGRGKPKRHQLKSFVQHKRYKTKKEAQDQARFAYRQIEDYHERTFGSYPDLQRLTDSKQLNPRTMKTRRNFKPKALPARIPKTSRSRATSLYVYPKTLRYPIGDLYHARQALVFVLSPTNAPSRKTVAKAVQKAYPTYDWGAWWNSKRKGKRGVPTWNTLVGAKKSNPKKNPTIDCKLTKSEKELLYTITPFPRKTIDRKKHDAN